MKQQPFEQYPALASWIERMGNTGSSLSLGDWMVFIGALNEALIIAARRPDHFVDADDMVGRPDEWQPIETASKCDTLLLFGTMLPHHELSIAGAFIFTGYWDEIDSSWCSTGSTWTGPFFKATHWMPLPAAPKEGE